MKETNRAVKRLGNQLKTEQERILPSTKPTLTENRTRNNPMRKTKKMKLQRQPFVVEKRFESLLEREAGEIMDSEVISSDNTVCKDRMVKATIGAEKNLANVVSGVDNEDLFDRVGDSRSVANCVESERLKRSKEPGVSGSATRQSNKRKVKAQSSHGMRARNASGWISGQCLVNVGVVEEEVDNVVAVG
ncbi:hypothetical protein QYF36_018969 [Acer negundo]|nr:hypothetical protein QYF36_018969 [Acer negundo]